MANIVVSRLIARCLRSLGVIAQGRDPADSELDDALDSLNEYIGYLNRDGLMTFRIQRVTDTVVASTVSRTIGTGGNITTAGERPDSIERCGIITGTGTAALERPVRVLRNESEWASISLKSQTSSEITRIYYDPTMLTGSEYGTIYYFPVPSASNSLVYYVKGRLLKFTTTEDQVTLPDGYLRMLRTNFALELASDYPGAKISPLLMEQAKESKAAIQSANQKFYLLQCPPELLNGPGYYDWRSDDMRW